MINRTRQFIVLLALLCTVPVVTVAHAQQIHTVGLDSVAVAVRGGVFIDDQSRDFLNNVPTVYNEHGFFETVRARVGGYFYHPALATWQAGAKITLKQRRFGRNGQSQDQRVDETIPEYKFKMAVLRDHPVTGLFNASQIVSYVSPNYRSTFNVKRRNFNGALSWRFSNISQILTAADDLYESDDLIRSRENRRRVKYEARQRTRQFSTQLSLEYQRTNQLGTGLDLESHAARFQSAYHFGVQSDRVLNVTLYSYRQLSRFDTRNQEGSLWTQQSLGRGFAILGSATRRLSTTNTEDTRTNLGRLELTHQLFQSLNTSASFDVAKPKFSTGQQSDEHGRYTSRYHKRTFFGGLGLFANGGRRRFSELVAAPLNRLQSEEYVASYSVSHRITDTRADAVTIEVRDDSQPTVILSEGLDYRVNRLADVIEISILPTGTVREGDQMRVSYFISVDASYGYTERERSYGVDLKLLRWIYLAASKQRSHRDLDFGQPDFLLLHSRATRLISRLDLSGFEVRGEYGLVQNESTPFKSRLAGARYTHPLHRRLNLLLEANFTDTQYFDGLGNSLVRTVHGGLWFYPGRSARLESRLDYAERRGRQDDGHDIRWTNQLRYITQLLTIGLDYVHVSRYIEIVGTEDRDVFSASIQRDF